MKRLIECIPFCLLAVAGSSLAQPIVLLRDIDPHDRVRLSRDELNQLIPGARMAKGNAKGNTHRWTNEAGGSFMISSDSKATQGAPSTSPGKWSISEDGRYCMLIEWRTTNTEDWCRYVIRSGGNYYAVDSYTKESGKAYRLEISR